MISYIMHDIIYEVLYSFAAVDSAPARARVLAGTGSCAGRNGLVCWARVPVGMGSCGGRHRLVYRPAWAFLLTGLMCQPTVAGTDSSASSLMQTLVGMSMMLT